MTHQKWCIVQQALNFSDMEIGAIIDDFQNMTGINKAAGHVEWDAILGYDPRLANSGNQALFPSVQFRSHARSPDLRRQ